ncbi:polygalacturonase [Evansella vedderi]|uniref:Polygalacturonase n=1 Tax=Evansella vedderi TaxID=38282 RepID=A0ABT9ZS63_9BACI|nr:spore coat protein [Evansella vedderi]MDQ0254076.1 polygalacturonase [Evansella vedderi]
MNQLANQMSDQAIATDLLLSAKEGVKNCAYALTEATSDDVRKTLNQQLQQAVIFQQKVADYMISQGYYHPYSLNEQIQVDQMTAQSVIQYSQQQQSPVFGQQPTFTQSQNMQQSYQQSPGLEEQFMQGATVTPSQAAGTNTTGAQPTASGFNNQQTQQTTAGANNQQSQGTPDINITIEDTDPTYEQSVDTDKQYYEMADELDEKLFLLPEGHEEKPSEE